MMYKIYLPLRRNSENEFSVNNINLKSYIGSVVPSTVDLRHDKSHLDACKKWVKSVDHIFLDRIELIAQMRKLQEHFRVIDAYK